MAASKSFFNKFQQAIVFVIYETAGLQEPQEKYLLRRT
jgi:hypothetical protein